jgi:hypothetical protein
MNWTELRIESKGGLLFGTCNISRFHNTIMICIGISYSLTEGKATLCV